MSKLDQLIETYCPNGVEYVKLGEVVTFLNGRAYKQSELLDAGKYRVLRVGNFFTSDKWYFSDLELDEDKYCNNGDLLYAWAASLGPQIWDGDKTIFHYHIWKLEFSENVVMKRFLYHFLLKDVNDIYNSLTHSTMPHVSMANMKERLLPIPPLEVQREIVRILDSFTELRAELNAELSAELTARKEQYEYYKDILIPFESKNVEWLPLGDVCTIVRGASPRPIKQFITDDSNGVNWIKIGDVAPGAKYITGCSEKITQEGAKKSRAVKPGDFILSNSMSFGRPYILQIDGCIHDGWLAISDFEDYLTADYLYHVLTSNYIQKEMKKKASFGGAVQNLNADIVRSIEVPVIPKEKQTAIVAVLDSFSVLCTDISSGLLTEIDARNKQYQYYLNKLLTFRKREAVV